MKRTPRRGRRHTVVSSIARSGSTGKRVERLICAFTVVPESWIELSRDDISQTMSKPSTDDQLQFPRRTPSLDSFQESQEPTARGLSQLGIEAAVQ
jgi:hypothetical protein